MNSTEKKIKGLLARKEQQQQKKRLPRVIVHRKNIKNKDFISLTDPIVQ